MVQLLLRMSDSPGDWGLVELQGQLETRDEAPFDNMHLGDLHFDPQVDTHMWHSEPHFFKQFICVSTHRAHLPS